MRTMNDSAGRHTMLGYDVDVAQLWHRIMARRTLVFGVLGVVVALALLYLHIATYTYTATLMVSPVLTSSSSSVSNKLGGLGGLASLAGININADQQTQAFALYQEGLYSRDVADELARNPEVLHTVYSQAWDGETKQWIRPSGPVPFIAGLVKAFLGIPTHAWQPPDGALLQEFIQNNVSLDTNPQKAVVTVTYKDKDPAFAVKFLRELDRAVDNKLRQNALTRANQYVDYLTTQLSTISNNDIRESLITTLTDQEKNKMMASATAPYAAQPFGEPSASRRPTSPKTFLLLALAIVFGAAAGVAAALWMPPLRWKALRTLRRHAGRSDAVAR
jgi:hypothetical protein